MTFSVRSIQTLILLLTVLAFSCSRKSSISETDKGGTAMTDISHDTLLSTEQATPDTIIWYSRSGCFGKCPVYSFLLFENMEAIYSGRAYVDNIGTFSFTLEEDTFSSLMALIQGAGLDQFEASYPQNESEWIVDLPTSTIVYFPNDSTKQVIKINHSPPEKLKIFLDDLEMTIDSIDWMGF